MDADMHMFRVPRVRVCG